MDLFRPSQGFDLMVLVAFLCIPGQLHERLVSADIQQQFARPAFEQMV